MGIFLFLLKLCSDLISRRVGTLFYFAQRQGSARDRDGAWRELETSLKRLQTNYLDLWQFHALTHDWDLDTILSKGGAIRAAIEAKKQGLIRSVGITGHHNPEIIVKGLSRYAFDTALVPINAADTLEQLEKNIRVAQQFKPLLSDELAMIEQLY
ncbi:aldo/keto reductase [Gloeothece verrucosa]|uniref:aldo/keto reductase n=1 Tax=Gloeothece verrucosa TaxID=2546359 RepID=UPI00017E2236|nr:aldo/keto reductase [Gloeothece verrucosa]